MKLPHITRRFPALFFLLGIFISVNLLQGPLFGFDEEKNLQYMVMKNPQESIYHQKLGQYYLNINIEAAQREYLLAEESYQNNQPSSSNPLGVESSPWQTWKILQSQRQRLEQELKYWESIHLRFPSYLYAVNKLSVILYQLGKKEEAGKYTQMVLRDSPTEKTALQLKELLN